MKKSVKRTLTGVDPRPVEKLSLVDVDDQRFYNKKDVFLNSEIMIFFIFQNFEF